MSIDVNLIIINIVVVVLELHTNNIRSKLYSIFFHFSIWCRANEKNIPDFDVSLWGWKTDGDGFTPLWMTKEEASKACKELVKCGCKIFTK